MGAARELVKKALPEPVLNWYRRRRARRQYLKALSHELVDRQTELDYVEAREALREGGFYDRMAKDVLERTDVVLQELDRRIEALSARSGQRLSALEKQVAELRSEMARLRASLEGPGGETGEQPASAALRE